LPYIGTSPETLTLSIDQSIDSIARTVTIVKADTDQDRGREPSS
jgi:hypothetical protein